MTSTERLARDGSALRNLRDVGGPAVGSGGRIRTGVLYRSDAPLPGDRAPELEAWPPRTVIDLRSAEELGGGHPLAGPRTEVIALPLSSSASPARLLEQPDALAGGLPAFYRRTLRKGTPAIVEAVGLVADRAAPVLVHCTAGKDRTGLVIATLLAALGVARDDVVADYRRSSPNMPGVVDRMADPRNHGADRDTLRTLAVRHPDLLDAPGGAIGAVLDALEAAGGAQRWLREHGLPPDALARLAERLVA